MVVLFYTKSVKCLDICISVIQLIIVISGSLSSYTVIHVMMTTPVKMIIHNTVLSPVIQEVCDDEPTQINTDTKVL